MPHPLPGGEKYSKRILISLLTIGYQCVTIIPVNDNSLLKGADTMKYTIKVDAYKAMGIEAGDKVMVLEKHNENTGVTWYTVSKSHAEIGYPGNMDHNERRFHGWRGTTDNVSTTACGVYEVLSVEPTDKHGEFFTVKVSRKDLKKGEE